MEIKGKILQINDPQTGQSARGEWKKQEIIIETEDKFPKKVCLLNWNDKVDIKSLKPGDLINAYVNVESREFKGRWFTDIKVWKYDKNSDNNQAPASSQATPQNDIPEEDPFADSDGDDDDGLPF